jgi:hypothetical protein
MSGSGAQKRNHALALRASKLNDEGFTARQISTLIGKRPEQVKAIIALGERLRDLERTKK